MSIVIKPRSNLTPVADHPSIFLAGSIDNGTAENWQERVERELVDCDVNIYNPRRDNWDATMVQDISNPEFYYQVNWELDNIDAADCIFVYFSPHGPAPITLLELGLMHGRDDIIVCCPDGYWRKGNVQVVCERNGWEVHDTLDTAIEQLRACIK